MVDAFAFVLASIKFETIVCRLSISKCISYGIVIDNVLSVSVKNHRHPLCANLN